MAARNLGRQWIGIDVSPTACRVMAKRLRDVCHMKESEPLWKARRTDAFVVRDLPWTVEKLKPAAVRVRELGGDRAGRHS